MNELTHINTDLPNEAERLSELNNEDNVKRAIQSGKGTRQIIKRYDVSFDFVVKCRKELRNEGAT